MKRFNDKRFTLTPQRMAILSYLDGNTRHPSAEEIYKAVAEKFPTMSVATVYNTLETLRRRGNVTEITLDPHKKRFDPNPEPHHHLMCVRCRHIVDVHTAFDLDLTNDELKDFQIIGNHITFYGVCPKCVKKGSKNSPS